MISAQTRPPGFEVVSVKASAERRPTSMIFNGTTVNMASFTAEGAIQQAFGVRTAEIIGAPDWAKSDSTRVAKGGTMGGVQWGSANDGANVYVAVSDIKRIMLTFTTQTDADPKQGGGMFAIRLSDGKQIWSAPPPVCGTRPRCSPAQSAAVTAIPGVAFSGSVDGHMRAYSAADGKIIWDFDTEKESKTINGVPGRGGSIDGPGPVFGAGMMFMNSGYVSAGGAPGNVLLGLSVDGK